MASRSYQYCLEGFSTKTFHGGAQSLGKRKTARPIATKRPMHVILKSSNAKGKFSLHRKARAILLATSSLANRFGVKVLQQSNNGNHIHLLVQARERKGFKYFLMALSGRIAQLMTGATKGRRQTKKFWDAIPFTRIVNWGKDLRGAAGYVVMNWLEGEGLIPHQPRKSNRGS